MTPTDKFQELIFILRDWNPSQSENKNILFGPKSGERYLSEINKIGNHELNKYFQNLYCYLMPSAGSAHKRSTVEFNRLSDQFVVEMTNLIRLKVLNINEMAVKKNSKIDTNLKPDQLNELIVNNVINLNGISYINIIGSKSFGPRPLPPLSEHQEEFVSKDYHIYDEIKDNSEQKNGSSSSSSVSKSNLK